MRRYWAWFLVMIVIGLAGLWGWMTQKDSEQSIHQADNKSSDKSSPPNKEKTTARAQLVSVTHIQRQDVDVWLTALGTVTPLQQVTVRSRIDGELMALHFTEGAWVKKGQLLASIDPRPLEAQLAQHEAQAQRDQALLNNAKTDLKRYQQLVKDEAVSAQQIDTQASLVAQYEANLAATRAQIANTKLNLGYCQIHAPISGRLGFRKIDAGNHIRANDAEGIVQIRQLDPISIIFSLPEQHALPLYQSMQQGKQNWVVEAWQKEQQHLLATGRVMSIDNQLDTGTSSLKFKAIFDNPQQTLLANQFVRIRLNSNTFSNTMTLPKAAIFTTDKGAFIYMIQEDDRILAVPIQVLHRNEEIGVIAWQNAESPIDETRPIVLEGGDKLKAGSLVRYQKK